jgi:hypothetical protein
MTRMGDVARMEEMRPANEFLIGKRTVKIHLCYKYKREVKFVKLRMKTDRSGLCTLQYGEGNFLTSGMDLSNSIESACSSESCL